MNARPSTSTTGDAPKGPRRPRAKLRRLMTRTLRKSWDDSLFSEAAEAAFWQTLSLPPLLLGLLGSLGFVADWFGPEIIQGVHDKIVSFCNEIFSGNVVRDIITPTLNDILSKGRGEIVSIGFLISLWAGSSAMSSFVDAITVAHNQYGTRNLVWQRLFALLLYLVSLALLIVGLPVIALGPDVLVSFVPVSWRPQVSDWISTLYYPATGVLGVLAVATLYFVALPRRLPWHRALPGAVLAVLVFLLASSGLRLYISWIGTTGYTYGALATPIAFLLFTFFIGLAIVFGAHFNAAIQEQWPAKESWLKRRRWRLLERERLAEQAQADEDADRSVAPRRPPGQASAEAGLPAETPESHSPPLGKPS